MTVDIEKLEVLAKAASQGSWNQDGFDVQNDDIEDYRVSRCNLLADAKFIAAANPAAVLALIAESERLKTLRSTTERDLAQELEVWRHGPSCWNCGDTGDVHDMVGEWLGQCDCNAAKLIDISNERDQLRAEVAGLRTGYEAYERVNAELKAEVGALRKDADRAAYWKQRAKSAEGHLFSGDFRAAAMELHKYSRFESTPWPELTGSQHALISSAAGAVIATVNRLRDARRPKNRDETDAIIWCACGDGYPVNSHGAGFMDANNGVCANCDAAVGSGRSNSRGSEQDQIPTETPVPERSACRSENP